MTAMDHVRYLTETIGPRGSTTVVERTETFVWELLQEIDRQAGGMGEE